MCTLTATDESCLGPRFVAILLQNSRKFRKSTMGAWLAYLCGVNSLQFSYLASNKKKTWKNLKQIISLERSLLTRPDDPTYSSIDAPPPLKSAKKYADMSGFTAKYTDPLTGIFFSTSEEFHLIRSLPSDIIQGYLALRGKLTI